MTFGVKVKMLGALSDRSMRQAFQDGTIIIQPFNDKHVQPASYDLMIELDEPVTLYPPHSRWLLSYLWDRLRGKYVRRGFVLASTVEMVSLHSNVQGSVHGRSSIGRLGVLVHFTAGFVDPGFRGQITLEMIALHKPVQFQPGDRVAQIAFTWLDQDCEHPYSGRYQYQRGPVLSRFTHGDEPW